MTGRQRRLVLVALWTCGATACVAVALFPAFAHALALEAFPIGCAAGWLARDLMRRRR